MKSLLRVGPLLNKYRLHIFGAAVCMLGATGANLVMPWLIKVVIDEGLLRREAHLLWLAGLAVLGVTLLKGVVSFGQNYLVEYVSQGLAYDLRNLLYSRLQRLSFSYYDKAHTGQLMTRATSDVDSVRMFFGMGILNILSTALLASWTLAILLTLHWKLALVSMVPMPILFWRAFQFGHIVRPLFMAIQEQFGKVTTLLQENFTGVRIVKSFAREPYEIGRFWQELWEFLKRNLEATRVWSFHFPLMAFITSLGTILILWYGGREVIAGRLTVGTLVAFNSYLLLLVWPVRTLGWVVNLAARAVASADRIWEVVDAPSEVVEKPSVMVLPQIKGDVRFEKVWFGYDGPGESLVNVSLHARPGEVMALIGASGSGKTSLVHLIPRFYDVRRGRVLVDGHDVREVTLESLRRRIGIVLQDTFLFSASIAENIAYGRPGTSMKEITEVAKLAQLYDFVSSLPDGYDTLVGERGITLSGGERQRVAIARALLMDPQILVLDDATSNVDAETEYLIQQALANLMKGRTTFVIAHRLSTVKNTDQILVLERGRIVERGSHQHLIALGGQYAHVYSLQLRATPLSDTIGTRGS